MLRHRFPTLHLEDAAPEEVSSMERAFDLILLDEHSKVFYLKHNLVDPGFTPVGLCSKWSDICRL